MLIFIGSVRVCYAQEKLLIDTISDQSTKPDFIEKLLTADSVLSTDTVNIKPADAVDSAQLSGAYSDDIQTVIKYKADTVKTNLKTKLLHLKGNAQVDYSDVSLQAENIEVDWNASTLNAYGYVDSVGKDRGIPVFTDNSGTYEAKAVKYNYVTKKAVVSGFVTKQGEGYVYGDKVKKFSEEGFYAGNAHYTTCNLEHPHFKIRSKKIKRTDKGTVVTGPFFLEVNDVPTPLAFPFGLFPVPDKKTSGFIMPDFVDERERGFGLKGLGYYWLANEHLAFTLLGDIYTSGSFGGNLGGQYVKRYRYSGNFSLRYQRNIRLDENIQSTIWVNWSHAPVQRGSARFSASVDAGSTQFNELNSESISDFLSPTFNSNVNYNKTFRGTPFSLNMSARHNQNTQTGVINFTLPDLSFSMRRIYPFKTTGGKRKAKFIENFNLQHNMTAQAKISNDFRDPGRSFTVLEKGIDTVLDLNGENIGDILRQTNFGVKHTIPLQTSVKLFKYFNLNPSFNYDEFWYTRKLNFTWVNPEKAVDIDTLNGFFRASQYSTSANLSTIIYGTLNFKRGKKIKAIRHQMTPNIGFSYRPDFADPKLDYYQTVQVDDLGNTQQLLRYENAPFGAPTRGSSGSLNFSLSNLFEMKILDKEKADTVTDERQKYKKVKLLNNLSISGSYNFLADSLRLSPFSISANTSLFKNVISINMGATWDPYVFVVDSVKNGIIFQRKVDQLAWTAGWGLGTISNANLSIGGRISPKGSSKKREERLDQESNNGSGTLNETELNYIKANPNDYIDFNIPWNLSFNYSLRYSKTGFLKTNITQSLSFNGDFSLTPKWKFSFTSGYDFEGRALTTTRVSISRDLHCWDMSLTAVPFGTLQSFSFHIGVKASILQALKLSKNQSRFDN